jgi:DNA (cytosine-5)-methyltransferase 1
MRYIELFAGAGGMSHGLESAGMTCVAHAEIDPHAQAVLRHHWPNTPLHGDVTQVDWAQYAGRVDLVSGGSPCQDLSVAGQRKGLAGEKSGLFFELIRAWEETRATYCLWENVDGARSSNKGRDFAAVLSAFVGADVTVPATGWRSSGVAAGPTGVAAWRVLDLQHFGPPQRRRRVFIVATRTGGVDPAEILALSEGVCGHPSPRQQARENAAADVGGGAESVGVMYGIDDETNARVELMGTLPARKESGGVRMAVVKTIAFHQTQTPISGDIAPALGCSSAGMGVLDFFSKRQYGHYTKALIASTLGARDHAAINVDLSVQNGGPRRMTPKECERVMGWPDDWTRYGLKEDGTVYAMSDTARYRMCGNGVGSPCAAWIAGRLQELEAVCPR